MSYKKKTWSSGDVITKEALNNIEEGIATLDENQNEFVTEEELNSKGYLTEHQDISHLTSKQYVDNAINNINTNLSNNYATKDDIGDISAILDYINGEEV